MAVENLFEKVTPWFKEAFDHWGQGLDDLAWALSLTTLPDPARNGAFTSAITLYSQMPTGRKDEHVANTVMMSAGFTRDGVFDNVRDLVANFRQKIYEVKNAEPEQRPQPVLADLGKTNGQS